MDSERFDRLTKVVGKTASRRSALRGLVTGAMGAGLGLVGAATMLDGERTALAKKCNGNGQCKNPKNPCKKGVCKGGKCRKQNERNGKSCKGDGVCSNGSCVADCESTGESCAAGEECCSAVCACGDPTGWANKPEDDTCWPDSFSQGFEQNLDGWYDFRNQFAPTDPQNRVFPPEETIERVCGEEDGITANGGDCFAKVLQGTAYPPVEDLTALTTFGGFSSVFPNGGYQTSIDIYLDVAATDDGQRFAYTSALDQQDCEWGGDFIFHVGKVGGDYCIRGGNDFDTLAGPAPCTDVGGNTHIVLDEDAEGWFRFMHEFTPEGASVKATMTVFDPSGDDIGQWTPALAIPGLAPGGNRYGWFPWNDLNFVAIDNVERSA